MRLSHELGHRLFDALYHAVALETGVHLVTTDKRYVLKAAERGDIVELSRWAVE